MQTPKNFYNIYAIIEDLSNSVLENIDDYKKIIDDYELYKDIRNIKFVYMYSIILDMGKTLAVGGNDKSGLKALLEIAPDDFKKRILQTQENYTDIISKLKNNRNRIIAHVDISNENSYFNLGFSALEIEEEINNHKKLRLMSKDETESDTIFYNKLKSLVPNSIKDERYGPSDFLNDIETFKKIIAEVLEIVRDLNIYFYSKSVAQVPSK